MQLLADGCLGHARSFSHFLNRHAHVLHLLCEYGKPHRGKAVVLFLVSLLPQNLSVHRRNVSSGRLIVEEHGGLIFSIGALIPIQPVFLFSLNGMVAASAKGRVFRSQMHCLFIKLCQGRQLLRPRHFMAILCFL